MKASKKLIFRIAGIDALIKQAKYDEVWAIEPDSTWGTMYEFESIELLNTRIVVRYFEYNGVYPNRMVSDYVLLSHTEDVNYMLSWIKRSIRKGYRQACIEAKREAKGNN